MIRVFIVCVKKQRAIRFVMYTEVKSSFFFLIELRLKIPVNNISVISGLTPPREMEREKKKGID